MGGLLSSKSMSNCTLTLHLQPSALNAPTPAIQSILFFQPENTPSEQELASAIYHGCVKNHSRMRSLLVEVNEELPEGPLWKLLRMIGLAGPKIESRMVFEERDDYLLPEDVSNAQLKDKDAGCSERSSSSATLLGDEATQAKGGPRGPDLIRSKHIKVIPISSEADIWKDIEKTMEVDFFDTSKALWEVRLYRNSDPAAGRNAVVYLISHIMGDGISLMKLATGFFQAAGTGEHLEYVSPPRPQPRLLSFADRVKFWLWDT